MYKVANANRLQYIFIYIIWRGVNLLRKSDRMTLSLTDPTYRRFAEAVITRRSCKERSVRKEALLIDGIAKSCFLYQSNLVSFSRPEQRCATIRFLSPCRERQTVCNIFYLYFLAWRRIEAVITRRS